MPPAATEEITEIWTRFLAQRDDLTRATLIERYAYLVPRVAESMRRRMGVDLDDAKSAGYIALVGAVDEFDPARGTRFAPFACQRIRYAILDLAQQESFFPLQVARLARRVGRLTGVPTLALNNDQLAALSAALEVEIDQVYEIRLLILRGHLLSLEEVGPIESEEPPPEEQALASIVGDRIAAGVAALPEPDHTVIVEHWWRGRMLREIGATMNKSRQSVGLIESRALARLAEWLAADEAFIRAGGGE